MSYRIMMEPPADDDLARLPSPIAAAIRREILRFAANPGGRSRPTRAPFPPGQVFETEFQFGDMTCYIAVVFQYGQDEQTLHVRRVFFEWY